MSDYKMVPVVATEDMREAALAAYEGATDGGEYATYPDSAIAAKMIGAAIAKAPPFVVTDEMVEKAFAACNAAYEAARNEGYVIEHSAKAGVRAAIEAVLGGGV